MGSKAYIIFLYNMLQLVLLIKNSLYDSSMYGISSTVFIHLSNLLRYWGKMRNSSSFYEEILQNLWTSIRDLISLSFTKCNIDSENNLSMNKDELEKRLRIHQKIVNVLKNPIEIRTKKQARVRLLF